MIMSVVSYTAICAVFLTRINSAERLLGGDAQAFACLHVFHGSMSSQSAAEEAFAKLMALLRGAAARSREALMEAMGAGPLDTITVQDACGFFDHGSYCTSVFHRSASDHHGMKMVELGSEPASAIVRV